MRVKREMEREIGNLRLQVRARDAKITELGAQVHDWRSRKAAAPSDDNIVKYVNEIRGLEAEIDNLRLQVRARDAKITELGAQVHEYRNRYDLKGPSKLKGGLIWIWDQLPGGVQRRIEPFADFVDRVVK